MADMSARIYGVSEEKIETDLARLRLLDEYLGDFLKKSGRYYLVKQLNEHFIDLQEILTWASRPRGVRLNWKPDKSDINELKLVAFYYIRIRFPHLRIRELRDLFATRESWVQLKEALSIKVELSENERNQLGLESPTIDNEEDAGEKDDDNDSFSTATEDRDLREEMNWKGKYEPKLKSLYEDAKEQERIVKDSERPLALARRALKFIGAIPADPAKLSEAELDDVLRDIIARTNDLRKIIQRPKQRVQNDRARPKAHQAKQHKNRRRKKT